MTHTHVPAPRVRGILRSVTDQRRLATIVRTMASEIVRLTEDNIQLRAAIVIYRKVAHNSNGKADAQRLISG